MAHHFQALDPRRAPPFRRLLLMLRLSEMPGEHEVPADMGITADQAPLAQRWYDEPPAKQFQAPSSVQAPLIDDPPDCVPVPAGCDAVVVWLTTTTADEVDTTEATEVDRVVPSTVVAEAVCVTGVVTKTPPVLEENVSLLLDLVIGMMVSCVRLVVELVKITGVLVWEVWVVKEITDDETLANGALEVEGI